MMVSADQILFSRHNTTGSYELRSRVALACKPDVAQALCTLYCREQVCSCCRIGQAAHQESLTL